MQFAARSNFGEGESAYGEALREARARGGLLDLTVSNPTRCGFDYPAERLLEALADARALRYDAAPLGLESARQAICALYRDTYHADVAPSNLLLTASTSEAYSYLLRLFCEPGDAILVPSPSYPLFDLLARLHDVDLIPYPLVYHDGWQIDPSSLAAAVSPRTRAIVVIHPNNPTGHYCGAADREALYALATEHDLPLIVDEVFLDYHVEVDAQRTFASTPPVLTFVLGGLSKLLALPQMKLAWIAVCGPEPQIAEAMHRLEIVADTFLSVATPPQVALPAWLLERENMQRQILERIHSNLQTIDWLSEGTVVSRLRVEGGWTAILRVPANEFDTALALRLMEEHGVAIHPGSLYGFAPRGWLVVSLLTSPEDLREGMTRLLSEVA